MTPLLIPRTLASTLSMEADDFAVILIGGMPGVGKTTLSQSAFRDLSTVDLLDVHPRNLALGNAEAFFPVYGERLVLDHVETAASLFKQLPPPSEHLKLILVGNLPEEIKNAVLEHYPSKSYVLMPISQREYAGLTPEPFGQKPVAVTMSYPTPGFFDAIRNGFLPRGVQQSNHAFYEAWLAHFFSTVVRDVMKVSKETQFLQYMKALAAANMQEINHYRLAETAGISYGTAMYWTRFLMECGVIFEVPSLKLSTRRQVKRAKVAYDDTGLLCHLLEIRDSESLLASEHYLGIFEGFVAAEIVKGYRAWGEEAPLYFYRDTAKKHVELLLKTKTGILPVGFLSRAARPMAESLRHMKVLVRMGEVCRDPVFISDGTELVEHTDYAVISAAKL